jgi:hypothetical protein
MAGKSTNLLWTYLTPRRIYRSEVASNDGPPGSTLPVIHADVASRSSGSVAPPAVGSGSGFGSNTTLVVAAVKNSGTSARVNIHMMADAEGVGYAGTPAIYATVRPWVLAHSEVVTDSKLIVLPNMPAAKYCVTITDIVGDANMTIIEQHTE